jgi:modification methylase
MANRLRLPTNDNTPEALAQLRHANTIYRGLPWPHPFDRTTHRLHLGDARDLSWLPSESVHLVVTSPPYWTLKTYAVHERQLGQIESYDDFLAELDKAWAECARVLVPGGRICCVVGDVCLPRKKAGRHFVMPLHSDIQVQARKASLDCLTPFVWHKIANGVTEVEGNGAGFYGKPYQPGAVVKNDIEYILFLRKGGKYRRTTPLQKALSMLTKEEMQAWWPFDLDRHQRRLDARRPPRAISRRTCRTLGPHVLIRRRHRAGPLRRDRLHGARRGQRGAEFGFKRD